MKIMVCYDGSDASNAALKVAQEYAPKLNATLELVASVSAGGGFDWSAVKAEIEGAGGKCVDAVVDDDQTDGENLVAHAEREGVGAIFLGVRKVSKVGKLLFGSTAQYVILTAPCPVMSVNAGYAGGA